MAEEKSLKRLILVFFLLLFQTLSSSVLARSEAEVSLSFGPMSVGEERLKIDLSEFHLKVEGSEGLVSASWVVGSIQWVRLENELLLPRARALIRLNKDFKDAYILYNDEKLLLQSFKSEGDSFILETNLFISLFHPSPIKVFQGNNKIADISIIAKEMISKSKKTQLIDYSCAPFDLKISGLDGRYLTAGCQLIRTGEFGEEKPLLEVHFTSVNITLMDGTEPPFTVLLKDSSPVKVIVKLRGKDKKTVELRANLPERLNRFGTAIGFGPYKFEATENAGRKKSEYAPSLMLYGNLFLTRETSLRFFNALVANGPFFNNFGMYFGYELAQVLDKRVDLVALIGFQGLTFDYGQGTRSTTQVIYPQGFELAYRHAFGLKNYTLGLGMFLQPSDKTPYKNIWIRFGKKVFGEVNLISWEHGSRKALMWGFTVALPLAKFL